MSSMWDIPDNDRDIRARIRRYERALAKELERYGSYHDGAGKRFLLGPLYLAMGDNEGALRSFEWFERAFPDSSDEALQSLCWALALHRSHHTEKARLKLLATMLENRFLIPRLLDDLDQYNAPTTRSEEQELYYAREVPAEFLEIWSAQERAWCREVYESPLLCVRQTQPELRSIPRRTRPT